MYQGRGTPQEVKKNFEKSLKNPLTNSKPYGIINTNKGKDTLQTRKDFVAYLTETGALPEVRDEIVAELAKGEAKAQANRDLYAEATPIVLGALSATPVTIGELYDEIANELPEGFTKGKVQYLVTRVLTDKVTKIEGKVNTYTLKA